jgi:hypothetical protein
MLFFSWTWTQAQKCETYYGKTINCIDKDSLKQGFWYEYQITKILTTDSFRQNPKAIGFHNDKGEVETPMAEGNYKNNRKVGEWTFYVGSFYNDIFPPTSHTRLVTFTDTRYFFIIDTFWNFNAKVSNDSNELNGVVTFDKEEIVISCKNKKCFYKAPFDKNKKEFKFKNLDDILYELNVNNYRRKRKKIGS